ncbi:hypothetical protein UK23_03940 [Lentzea aerocolonigenes]|uniref:Chaplin domain-containing protein n=1 Tax=Lentzea aerocolonigenes TaxID=68170 RepID=A0A0F0HD78_LENAE|nr:hypothetical protein [Lentzea aerocolonigenes]KJK52292.1 hypothetical protein UK23_03940 [Lentzea aerocolonigenes]
MLKKAGAALGVAAAFLAVGSPAMAVQGHEWENAPLLIVGNANNLNLVGGVCGNNVGVFGGAVPVNSPSITETCAAGGIEDGVEWGDDED